MTTNECGSVTQAIHPASFRDPSGFVFLRDGVVHRQVNACYASHYELLVSSGLYRTLVSDGRLLPHEDVPVGSENSWAPYKLLRPEQLSFISYPYEWSYSALKDAALTSLSIQKTAMQHGMTLKDCSAFNIQFCRGKPVLIDTLSFEKYDEGTPWAAYRQFCQHFLAPLALGAYKKQRVARALMRNFVDGIPLDIASGLLPRSSWLRFGLFAHLHLHAKAQRKYAAAADGNADRQGHIPASRLLALLENLESTVRGLTNRDRKTEWCDYYQQGKNNYTESSASAKARIISRFIDRLPPLASCWDFGGNTGRFSALVAERGVETIVFDIDEGAVEICYQQMKRERRDNLLPLVFDLVNPTPAIGWQNREREDLWSRTKPDLVMALALIHHLAIANNVPLSRVADLLGGIAHYLIVEFVPKSDSQVKILLSSRADIFPDYSVEGFETAFAAHFTTLEKVSIPDSDRILYLMEAKKKAGIRLPPAEREARSHDAP